jgi:4-amino-4-deoxy-L-arabinose transferase-like glycosyltransferase
MAAVLVLLFAWEFFGVFVGVSAAIIFLGLPFFVGLSQLVTTESILVFIFTLTVYSFIKLLKRFSFKLLVITGVFTGLALQVKQSNLILFPIFILMYLALYINSKKQIFSKQSFNYLFAIGLIFIISVITFLLLWPMVLYHLDDIARVNQNIWMVKTSPPVIFWGKLMLSPIVYFPVMFFVTTPAFIIALSILGLLQINKNRINWIYLTLIIWFMIPFLQSFYPWRHQNMRYIVEVYVPLSIMAALGINYFVDKFKRNKVIIKILSIMFIMIYLIFILIQQSPYYLDYFNELVGGTRGVYEKRYFDLGWWGSGLREAAIYLKDDVKPGSKIGLFISPVHTFPRIDNQNLVFINPNDVNAYKSNIKYDYIVVNDFHVLREGFRDDGIKRDYKLIHEVLANGAPIVSIYKSLK